MTEILCKSCKNKMNVLTKHDCGTVYWYNRCKKRGAVYFRYAYDWRDWRFVYGHDAREFEEYMEEYMKELGMD